MNPHNRPFNELLAEPLPPEPLSLAIAWLNEARRRAEQPNPNAMVLATADATGRPSARVVLCKEIVADPGYVMFYTNYESRKGRELSTNARAAVVMHWDQQHRQLRIEGVVTPASGAESDAYFASRPWQSRIGAWASAQSQPIASRHTLLAAVARAAARFGVPNPDTQDPDPAHLPDIPRPPHWGGYRLYADAVEFWVEGQARVHDRVAYTRELTAGAIPSAGPWRIARLQP